MVGGSSNGRARSEAVTLAAQVAAAECFARAIVLAFDVAEDSGMPFSAVQKIAILEAALVEFDGFESRLAPHAPIADVLGNAQIFGNGSSDRSGKPAA
jgi:hypothetical protein